MTTMTKNPWNAHLVNSYWHHAVGKLAKNGLSVQNWSFLILSGWVIDLAGPGDKIEWVSITEKIYSMDNETKYKYDVLYKQVKEFDTFIVKVSNGTPIQSMVWQNVDIDNNQDIDLSTVWSGTQFRIERVVSADKVEVYVLENAGSTPGGSYTASNWAKLDGTDIQLDIDWLTEDANITDDDYIPYLDSTTGEQKKVKKSDILWNRKIVQVVVATNWQTTFTLPDTPVRLTQSDLVINEWQTTYWQEYTISGTTLTFNPAIAWYELETTDDVYLWYYY